MVLIIQTHRFGDVDVSDADQIHFPEGLIGLSTLKRFVMIADPESPDLNWLQSIDRTGFALATFHHSKIGWEYRVEVQPQDIAAVAIDNPADAEVFVILNRADGSITANLRGPLLINPQRMLGKQIVQNNPTYQVRMPLAPLASAQPSAMPAVAAQ